MLNSMLHNISKGEKDQSRSSINIIRFKKFKILYLQF